MENLIWKNTANRIIIAILIYSIAGFIGPIMAGIGSCISSVDGIYDYTVYEQAFSENYGATINYWEFLGYTFELFAIAGYAIFFTAIGKFSKIQKDEEDSRAVRMIRTSYILLAAGTLVGYLFLVGTIIKAILFITSYILLIIGYSRLKNSQRIPEKGRKGAGKLFLCAILGLVASILGAIPLAGDFIEGVMQLAIFIIALTGWSQIKNGAPEADKNDMFQQAVHTKTKETKSLTTLVLTDTIMGVVFTILFMLHSVLPSIEMSDFPVPFATGLGVYTNIAFLIYLIVFTTKRRGALQLTGALVMVTITTFGVIDRIFPLHFIFVGDYYEGVSLFYDVYAIVNQLLFLTAYILLTTGMKVSNMFRIATISVYGTYFIFSIVQMIMNSSNDYIASEELAVFYSIWNITAIVLNLTLITFSIIENRICTKKATDKVLTEGC